MSIVLITISSRGLRSLAVDGLNLPLLNSSPQVLGVKLARPTGIISGPVQPIAVYGSQLTGVIVSVYSWGTTITAYSAVGNRLNIDVSVHSEASDVIPFLWLSPLALRLPTALVTDPMPMFNVNGPSSIFAVSAPLSLALCNDDVLKPLLLRLTKATSANHTDFRIDIATDPSGITPSYPVAPRPIAPGATDRFKISLRFGGVDDTEF